MKKILKTGVIALCLICLAALLASCSNAETDPETGLLLKLDKDTETYTVVGCTDSTTEINIPDKYNGVRITAIGSGAFKGNTKLTAVTIPSTIESIGGVAFDSCTELKTVVFEDFDAQSKLTELPSGVFNKCGKLSSVEIPDSVKVIGYRAFSECSLLETLSLPYNLNTIMNYAFAGCAKLEEVDMQTLGGFSVYSNAFADCPSLTTLATPETYTDADREQVFYYDPITKLLTDESRTKLIKYLDPKGEAEYTIPLKITEIEDGAFMSQKALTLIKVEEGHSVFRATEDGVLYKGTTLVAYPVGKLETNYQVPADTTEIGEFAFAGNAKLKAIDLSGAAITNIGISAFKNCEKLTVLSFPSGEITVGLDAFVGCDELTNYTVKSSKEEYLLKDRVLLSKDGKKLISYPADLKDASYTLPAEITEIVPGAFAYNSSLERYFVAEGNLHFAAPEDGVLYSVDATGKKLGLVAYPIKKTDAEYTAPQTLTSVSAYAFAYNTSIKKVTLPSGVIKLDLSLFVDCAALEELTVLTRDELSIEANALAGCVALKTVNFGGNTATWELITSNAKLGSGNIILKEEGRVTVNCDFKLQ